MFLFVWLVIGFDLLVGVCICFWFGVGDFGVALILLCVCVYLAAFMDWLAVLWLHILLDLLLGFMVGLALFSCLLWF